MLHGKKNTLLWFHFIFITLSYRFYKQIHRSTDILDASDEYEEIITLVTKQDIQ